MRGAITGKDVIFHSIEIVRLWGLGTYLHCLWAALTRRPSTFLGVLYADGRRARWAPAPNRTAFALAHTREGQLEPPEAA
jgi:hypothetical protein